MSQLNQSGEPDSTNQSRNTSPIRNDQFSAPEPPPVTTVIPESPIQIPAPNSDVVVDPIITPSPESKGQSVGGDLQQNEVRIPDHNSMVILPDGTAMKASELAFFGFKKQNYDRQMGEIRSTQRELKGFLESPLISTYAGIKSANPTWSDEQVQLAAVRALNIAPQQEPVVDQDPRPTPPQGIIAGEPEYDDYIVDLGAWSFRQEAKKSIQPIASELQTQRDNANETRREATIRSNNEQVLNRYSDFLPFNYNALTNEQKRETDIRVGTFAAERNIDLSQDGLGKQSLTDEIFENIVLRATHGWQPKSTQAPPQKEPAEIVTTLLNSPEGLVPRVQLPPPVHPTLNTTESGAQRPRGPRKGKDNWTKQLGMPT